jgi:hypothetical protein
VRKHGQFTAPAAESVFNLSSKTEAPAGGKITQEDASRNQISKRHDRLNQFNLPLGELLFELQPIPNKDDPRQRVIRTGKWTADWQFPRRNFGLERFVV